MEWSLRMTPEDYWDRHPDIALADDDGEILCYDFKKKADAIVLLGVSMKRVCAGCYYTNHNGYICTLVSSRYVR